jgi:hypothetical protein
MQPAFFALFVAYCQALQAVIWQVRMCVWN